MESLVLKVVYSVYFLWWDDLTDAFSAGGCHQQKSAWFSSLAIQGITKELTSNQTNKPQMTNPGDHFKDWIDCLGCSLGNRWF